MKLRLDYRRPGGGAVDLAVTIDAEATVGALAEALAARDPSGRPSVRHPGLAVLDGMGNPRTMESSVSVGESGLRAGTAVTLVEAPPRTSWTDQGSPAVLTVHIGPDSGKTFHLHAGANFVGRGDLCQVKLSDPMVSRTHARVLVGDVIEIVDDNSANGLLLGGDPVTRAVLRPGDRVTLGDSTVSVARQGAPAIGSAPVGATVPFNRSPRVDVAYPGEVLQAPEPPQPQKPQRFPVAMLVMPLIMGVAFFGFIASSNQSGGAAKYMSVIFMLLSPLMLVGAWMESRRSNKRDWEEAVELYRANLADLVVDLRRANDEERARRCVEHPGVNEVLESVGALGPLMWTRRPEHESFLELRLGLGTQSSRTTVEANNTRNSTPELTAELTSVIRQFATVERVPVVGSLPRSGSIGVSGPEPAMLGVARSLLLQLVGLHSPAELVVCGVASARSAPAWDWAKWLPHVGSEHSPLSSDPLASTGPAASNLVAELYDLVEARAGDGGMRTDDAAPLPAVLLLVSDDAPVERARLVRLAEIGPQVGVHLMWLAGSTASIPAACRSFVEVGLHDGQVGIGRVVEGEHSAPVLVEPVEAETAMRYARALAPVVDAGAMVDDTSDVPGRVSFLSEAGRDVADDPSAVLERWKESNSLLLAGAPKRRSRRDNSLRALVGRTAGEALHLDLRSQGPHALVGGTTGAGKSEFLQSWILGMATTHSPQRVTFLFVDYKGGSAFADCVNLPHTVGLVTDLSTHLVQRALTSLHAELRYREHILNRKRAKDLLELERRNDPETPPSLVIVVDEFAALVQEVPEFVDGVVNIAQRGRSLGLHLILATQRPAGVIKDNLRANTNLRVALRMADEDDSTDVVGSAVAAGFDPGIPGRAIAKTGPGRLTLFQSAYVGGWTSDTPPPPHIVVGTWQFGPFQIWEEPVDDVDGAAEVDPGPADIRRVVENVAKAAQAAELAPPRKPWLPELAHQYDLATLPNRRQDRELVFGVVDQPEEQQQEIVAFQPDLDGNIAVFGTGGSGKSTFLRTLAISAGLTARGGPCFVYGLDFGARGLSMLEALPHVGSVIGADDVERTVRLISRLRETVDERAVRYAAVNAGSIDEYRRIAQAPEEPRVLLLLDGFSAFRSAYETGPFTVVFDQLQALAIDGRPVGVHVALTADRLGAVPSSLAGSIQRKLALRLSNEMDESMLDVPRGGFGEIVPPGRGFLGGRELQVAVFGGSADVAAQAQAVEKLAASMRRAGAAEAPPIERLAELVTFAELPPLADGLPAFALSDQTLGPVGFEPEGVLLVAGPTGSGRSTAVATLVAALRRAEPGVRFAYVGTRRSPLAAAKWDEAALGAGDAADLASRLALEWGQDDAGSGEPARWVLVLDRVAEFINSDADYPLQDLLKVCRSMGIFVIADSESADAAGSWPLLQMIKAARHGLVLQPDQTDGDMLFRTSFPRMSRADFPVGRGMYVRAGRAVRVQVALS